MLETVHSAVFAALQGKTCELVTASGNVLQLEVLKIEERQNFRMPRAAAESRNPFSVQLRGPTNDFSSGLCTVRGEGLTELVGVHVNRIMGGDPDPRWAYYQIVFN